MGAGTDSGDAVGQCVLALRARELVVGQFEATVGTGRRHNIRLALVLFSETTKKIKTSRERPKSALYLRLKKRNVFKIVKGGPFGDIEKFSKKKSKKEIFEQCHSAKNVKGRTLWCNPKIFEKASYCRKNSVKNTKIAKRGIISMFSRLWTLVLFFLFRTTL